MIKLTNWSFSTRYDMRDVMVVVRGTITENEKLENGRRITTGIVEKVEETKDELIVKTYTGNQFSLDLAAINLDYEWETKGCLALLNINLDLDKWKNQQLEAEQQLKDWLDKTLDRGELYMQILGVYPQKAYFKDTKLDEVSIITHRGMFQNDFIIKGVSDFRCTISNGKIQPYLVSNNIRAICIQNLGSTSLDVNGKDCPAGKLTRIEQVVSSLSA